MSIAWNFRYITTPLWLHFRNKLIFCFFRYHKIGLIVLYLHDIADMFLAPGKIIDGVSKKRPSNILELLKIGIFVIFLTVW